MADVQKQQQPRAVRQVQVLLPQAATGDTGAGLVDEIVRALLAHPDTRAALEAGGVPTAAPPYVTLSRMGEGPPPTGVPFYNDAIGVLSVPAPAAGGAQAVREALRGVSSDIEVVEESTYRTR